MKKKLLIIGVIAVGIIVLLGIGGTVQTAYEYINQTITKEFVGYIDENIYSEEIIIEASQLPEWVDQFTLDQDIRSGGEMKIPLEKGKKARLALYADFNYIEQYNETRRALTGSLVEHYSEFYYKPTGTTYLLPVYEGENVETSFDHTMIKGE